METAVPEPGLLATAVAPASRRADGPPRGAFAIEVPAALLARARRGERAALEQIYRRFERPVYTLALRICGSSEEASDVLQEAMLKMIDRIGGYRGDSPVWGWLRQIAVNEALMLDRKSTRLNSSHVKSSYAVFCLRKRSGSRLTSASSVTISSLATFIPATPRPAPALPIFPYTTLFRSPCASAAAARRPPTCSRKPC